MRVAQSVAEILNKHVVLEVEGIDADRGVSLQPFRNDLG
jgi:hypothetical protein